MPGKFKFRILGLLGALLWHKERWGSSPQPAPHLFLHWLLSHPQGTSHKNTHTHTDIQPACPSSVHTPQ